MFWGSGSVDVLPVLSGVFQFWNPVKGLFGVEVTLGWEVPGVGWESGGEGEPSTGKAGLGELVLSLGALVCCAFSRSALS